ncbi:MAG: hypothetical protein AB7U59_16260 [Desulfovibrionaceae bacterium]
MWTGVLDVPAFETFVFGLEGHPGVIHELADLRLLGIGLERGPPRFLGHPEYIFGQVLVRILGTGGGFCHQGRVFGFKAVGDVLGEDQALAHLIRHAKGLAERKDQEVAKCGAWTYKEFQRLCHMAKAPPTFGEWNMFYARFIHLVSKYGDRPDDTGKLTR